VIAYLFIDEAQLLKPDMLELVRFLLNFETNTQKLLQIVLFGQNELATNLESTPTTPLSSALRFSALTMREIRLVIAPLDPGYTGEALLNRIRMQG
jgi:type II secretory pathway predicted ATPase ExeA